MSIEIIQVARYNNKEDKMFQKTVQLLYILVLASTCCKGLIFDFQTAEHHCMYRCGRTSYDLENMDKSLKLVRSAVSNLITLTKSLDAPIRGNRASINSLTSKISNLERENAVLKENLEKEKAKRISFQNMFISNQDRLNRTEALIRQMKEKVENHDIKTEAVKTDLDRLEIKVKGVLKNETHLFERLNALESSNTEMADPLGKENIANKVRNISIHVLALTRVQLEQKHVLSSLENQMQSFANRWSVMDNSQRNMSLRIEHLDLQTEAIKQKASKFDDILKYLIFSEKQDYQKQGANTIQDLWSILQQDQQKGREAQSEYRKQMINSIDQKQAVTLLRFQADQRFPSDDGVTSSLGVCDLQKSSGPCGKSYKRWYYDFISEECLEFTYGGCLGNQNRFRTKMACEEMCFQWNVPMFLPTLFRHQKYLRPYFTVRKSRLGNLKLSSVMPDPCIVLSYVPALHLKLSADGE